MSRLAPYGVREERERRSIEIDISSNVAGSSTRRYITWALLGLALAIQIVLLLISLVPGSIWTNLGQPVDGPIPHSLYWLTAGLFYILPAATGALCRRWQVAVVLATLPAWLDLGVFAIAASARLGPFNLVQNANSADTVGTLELFAALGALGWLARSAVLLLLADRNAATNQAMYQERSR